MSDTENLISIQKITLSDRQALLQFQIYALGSIQQIEESQGCIHFEAVSETELIWWTLTVWTNMEAMLAFRDSSIHQTAMKNSRKLGKTQVYHWHDRSIPTMKAAQSKLDSDQKTKSERDL